MADAYEIAQNIYTAISRLQQLSIGTKFYVLVSFDVGVGVGVGVAARCRTYCSRNVLLAAASAMGRLERKEVDRRTSSASVLRNEKAYSRY